MQKEITKERQEERKEGREGEREITKERQEDGKEGRKGSRCREHTH